MAFMNILPAVSHIQRLAPGSLVLDTPSSEEYLQSVSVMPDGKVLIGGDGAFEVDGTYTFAHFVVRLDPDGKPDDSFGTNGRLALELEGLGLIVQPDGALLIEHGDVGTQGAFGLTRLNTDGTRDHAFDANAAEALPGANMPDYVKVAVNPDGTIRVYWPADAGVNVIQLNADGTLDKHFGSGGTALLASRLFFDNFVQMAALDNGQFLLAANLVEDKDFSYAVMRLNADGSVDTSFGDHGYTVFRNEVLSYGEGEIVLQDDGKMVLAGDTLTNNFNVIRLDANGSFDDSFGNQGLVSFNVDGLLDWRPFPALQSDGRIVIAGMNAELVPDGMDAYKIVNDLVAARLNSDGSLDTDFGSPDGRYHLEGSGYADLLFGQGEGEIIQGFEGEDLLQGNLGRDQLYGGAGADVFRAVSLGDSYRTANSAASDRVQDFNPSEDRIDLMALGFSGFGDGHNHTVAARVNAGATHTYLKSFDADANGHRFELVLEGDLTKQLNVENVLFGPVTLAGSSDADVLSGTVVNEVLQGLAGNDRMDGAGGEDLLDGGEGRDRISGGDGNDVFRFRALADSYRTASENFSDAILDFDPETDRIDVSALGFVGAGDGTNGTLKVEFNGFTERTYLKSFEADIEGRRFEVSLPAFYDADSVSGSIVFAPGESTNTDLSLLGAMPKGESPAL